MLYKIKCYKKKSSKVMKKNLFFLFTITFFGQVISSQNNFQFIGPCNPAIYYSGRVDKSNSNFVAYDWPGIGVSFKFTGKSFGLKFKGGDRNYFNLFVNERLIEILHSPGDTIVWVNNLKGNGPHSVNLLKRTEGEMGKTFFYGVLLPENGKIFPAGNIPNRRIEFIGNSITCGYGTEGLNKQEKFHPKTENNYKSFGAILGRAFIAECRFTAHSGLGIVRNYGDKQKISTKVMAMPGRFNRVFDMDSLPLWDFSTWKPNLVVIKLGSNDFSTLPHPDKEVYQREYEKLILKVREVYGTIPVFCVAGPSVNDISYNYVKEVVQVMRNVHSDNFVYFVGLPDSLLNTEGDLGSDWHPSYEGHKKMAGQLVLPISTVLNWNYNASEIYNCK